MTMLTALIIATNDDIECVAGGPADNGKYAGWIQHSPGGRYHPLVNTQAIFDTPEAAVEYMWKLCERAKEIVAKANKSR